MENSAPRSSFRTLCKIVEIKIGGKTRFENLLKQLFHSPLSGCEVIITNSRYALVGYFITSYPTRAHGIIVIYYFFGPIRNSVRLLYFDKDSVITKAQMRMVCRVFTKFRIKNFFKNTADKRQKLDKLLKCFFVNNLL